ncbi:glycosyltransferase family 2 protein, partial [Chloroflexota bacterium]
MSKDFIATIIATCDRPDLLKNRSLPSVLHQTNCPDLVLVVDDSAPVNKSRNRDIVTALRFPQDRVLYLENTRTKGAAGAWNTAIRHLYRQGFYECWVALLDDDDEWQPQYLENCLANSMAEDADIVVSGLIRRTETTPNHAQSISRQGFTRADFYVGNPHWQGSNTFIRLSALIAAGGFDESFTSTNDRDLGIRLLDLGFLKWAFVHD